MYGQGTVAYGMYARDIALRKVIGALNQAGCDKHDICMVLSPGHPDAASLGDGDGFYEGRQNTIRARVIGWFSELGAVVIPTVGFFTRSEVFTEVLMKEHNFPSLSRGSRTLIGLGFPLDDAKRLGHQLCDFGALVYVTCRGTANADGVIELLRRAGAREAAALHTTPPKTFSA